MPTQYDERSLIFLFSHDNCYPRNRLGHEKTPIPLFQQMKHAFPLMIKRTFLALIFVCSAYVSKGVPEEEGDRLVTDKQAVTALFKKSGNPNNEQQANRIRVELWFYWEKKLHRVYQRLLQHYALRPELAEPLKTSQQAWLTARDATMHACGLCLKEGKENKKEDGWFKANMNIMIIEMTETRCHILEELLSIIQSCDL